MFMRAISRFFFFFLGGPFDTFVSISFGVRKISTSLETRKIGTDIYFVRSGAQCFQTLMFFLLEFCGPYLKNILHLYFFFSPYISEKNKVTGFYSCWRGFLCSY